MKNVMRFLLGSLYSPVLLAQDLLPKNDEGKGILTIWNESGVK